jgi:hypothetical protein
MKTPMEEMLEWVRATLPMELDWPMMIEQKIESLLEKEKEVINDAYLCGLNRGGARERYNIFQEMGVLCEWPSNRDYYEETFNTNEK